jgi:hypothetical protein
MCSTRIVREVFEYGWFAFFQTLVHELLEYFAAEVEIFMKESEVPDIDVKVGPGLQNSNDFFEKLFVLQFPKQQIRVKDFDVENVSVSNEFYDFFVRSRSENVIQ